MRIQRLTILTFMIIATMLVLSACQKSAQPEPTQVIYQPTRSVATLPAPTKAPTCNNVMGYVLDDYYEEDTRVAPGETFRQEWEVINYSDCNWDEQYHLFFVSGNQMGAPDFVTIPHIPIGSKGKITVDLTAPEEPGEYRSEWKLFGADNRFFGESLVAYVIVE